MTSSSTPSATDFALVNDLLDGRLDADRAQALRARIEREPGLRDLWDDLQQIRTRMRENGPRQEDLEVPPDFLARVRTGIAAAGNASAGNESVGNESGGNASVGNASVDASVDAAGPGPATRGDRPAGRMLRLLTVAYAAAALLVVGFSVHFALRDRTPDPAGLTTADRDKEVGSPGAVRDAGEGLERSARALEELRAPAKSPGASTAAGEKRPRRDAKGRPAAPTGPFSGPGGALVPGLRTPTDGPPPSTPPPADAPAPVAPDPPTPPAAGLVAGRLAAGTGEVLFVFEAVEPAQARGEVERLLAQVRFVAGGDDASQPKPASERKQPTTVNGASSADVGGGGRSGSPRLPPAARLYRVPAGSEALARLGSAPAAEPGALEEEAADGRRARRGKAKDEPDAPSSGPVAEAESRAAMVVLGTVEQTLDPASFARLETLVGFSTWNRDRDLLGKREARPTPRAAPTPGGASAPRTPAPPPAREAAARGVRVRIVIVGRP